LERHFFESNGVKLSYLDFGGPSERTLVALHGHFGTANGHETRWIVTKQMVTKRIVTNRKGVVMRRTRA
jgi:hypothetical protein